jgi:hypothetical protein
LTDKYIEEKEKYHFILILSETDHFHEFENKFYSEIISEKDKRKMLFGVQSKNYTKFIQPRLREYDNFRKLIYNFMKKKYKYVSYVFGGFEKIHEESIKYNIPLLNHDENCFLCKKKYSKISELSKDKENKKPYTAKRFFFGRKESGSNKNKNKENKEEANKNIERKNNNINVKNNDAHRNSKSSNKSEDNENVGINNNKEKKEGFFSKLFGKNNKNKNEVNAENHKKMFNTRKLYL